MQEVKKHRKDAPHLADAKTQAIIDHLITTMPSSYFDWRPMQYLTAVLLGLTCLPIGMLIQRHWIVVNNVAVVDGRTLTEDERDIVRGLRDHRDRLNAARRGRAKRILAYARELMEESGVDQSKFISVDVDD